MSDDLGIALMLAYVSALTGAYYRHRENALWLITAGGLILSAGFVGCIIWNNALAAAEQAVVSAIPAGSLSRVHSVLAVQEVRSSFFLMLLVGAAYLAMMPKLIELLGAERKSPN